MHPRHRQCSRAGSETMTPPRPCEDDDLARWSRLSDKHHEALRLLVERKTSKEIARVLGVSKSAVDQRFDTARQILGAASRNDAAIAYARLEQIYGSQQTCDRITCDPAQVPERPALVPSDFPDGDPEPVLKLSDIATPSFGIENGARESLPPFRDGWRHTHGIQARVVIMVAILAALVIVVFLGLGIAEALTRLVSH